MLRKLALLRIFLSPQMIFLNRIWIAIVQSIILSILLELVTIEIMNELIFVLHQLIGLEKKNDHLKTEFSVNYSQCYV